MNTPKLKNGFTILEVLIVLVVVGILAAVAVYSLNVTRAGNRDNKRISDVSVIRASLTQYWLQKASYPVSDGVDLGRPGNGAERLTSGGFVVSDNQVGQVILDKLPTGPRAGEYYRYKGTTQGYSLSFKTERQTVYGPAGTWYAHVNGVDKEDVAK